MKSAAAKRPSIRDISSLAWDQSLPVPHLGIRVLVADDDRDTLMTLGVLLRSEGFEVELVDRSRDVVNRVLAFRPHAAVLDIAMPYRSGYELGKELRRTCRDACPVLVALTGYSARIDELLKEAGFDHHVRKPYDPAALLKLLASVKTSG